jgi:hypothetical protein
MRQEHKKVRTFDNLLQRVCKSINYDIFRATVGGGLLRQAWFEMSTKVVMILLTYLQFSEPMIAIDRPQHLQSGYSVKPRVQATSD